MVSFVDDVICNYFSMEQHIQYCRAYLSYDFKCILSENERDAIIYDVVSKTRDSFMLQRSVDASIDLMSDVLNIRKRILIKQQEKQTCPAQLYDNFDPFDFLNKYDQPSCSIRE